MYAEMAALYDRLMDDVDYAAWAAYYLCLIERAGGKGAPLALCECGCGTGSLTAELIRQGASVTGADISEEMLRVAGEKLRRAGLRAPLVLQDMRALTLPKPADAVVCCCDGANYLLTDADLLAFFGRARASLKKGGVLAFDVSTRAKLESMGGQVYCDERDDVAYIWKNEWNGAEGLMRMELSFFARQPGGLYRRFEERHIQRGWRAEEILRLLEEAGFRDARAYGDRTFEGPGPGEKRAHFAAVNP